MPRMTTRSQQVKSPEKQPTEKVQAVPPKYSHKKKSPFLQKSFREDPLNVSQPIQPMIKFTHFPSRKTFQSKAFIELLSNLESEKEANVDVVSAYEDSQGNQYRRLKKMLGKGSYTKAYKFKQVTRPITTQSTSDNVIPAPAEKVVLYPLHKEMLPFIETSRLKAKYNFYKIYYGEAELFLKQGSYRLVVPFLPGKPYRNFYQTVANPKAQIFLMLSAITALRKLHQKRRIFLDMHPCNILLDLDSKQHWQSFLIDGDMVSRVGTPLSKHFSPDALKAKTGHDWFPPECWQADAKASVKIDTYGLGYIMRELFVQPMGEIADLLKECLDPDPRKRPYLSELEETLHSIKALLDIQEERLKHQHSLRSPKKTILLNGSTQCTENATLQKKPNFDVLQQKDVGTQTTFVPNIDHYFSDIWSKDAEEQAPRYLSNQFSNYPSFYRFFCPLSTERELNTAKRPYYPNLADPKEIEHTLHAEPEKKMKPST